MGAHSGIAAGDLLGFLFGRREAIQRAAAARGACLLGAVLVLLTAIPRNYDQDWIGDRPVLWLLGPLLFSLGSGTFLFLVLHGLFLRWRVAPEWRGRVPLRRQWVSFMGVFWLTAPIAWLYAIPVERFLDPLPAARANLWLLGVVAAWRVLLMARVVQVVNRAPWWIALAWVLVPAAVEVLAVTFFGGAFANRLAASMGGLRNSPEEDLVLDAVGAAMTVSLLALPVALMTGLVAMVRLDRVLRPFPVAAGSGIPWRLLAVAGLLWVAVAIPAQREVRRSVAVEELVESGRPREALDFLGSRQPGDFSPVRPLPPKAFEWSVFEQLPALFGAARADDPDWVRAHLMARLDEMCRHFTPPRGSAAADPSDESSERLRLRLGGGWGVPDPEAWIRILDGLARLPEGPEWVRNNDRLLAALAGVAASPGEFVSPGPDEPGEIERWSGVAERLAGLGVPVAGRTVPFDSPEAGPPAPEASR